MQTITMNEIEEIIHHIQYSSYSSGEDCAIAETNRFIKFLVRVEALESNFKCLEQEYEKLCDKHSKLSKFISNLDTDTQIKLMEKAKKNDLCLFDMIN